MEGRGMRDKVVMKQCVRYSPPSWPGLSRRSRLIGHRALLSGMPGTSPRMTEYASPLEPAAVQKRLLLRGRLAAEHGVAMREAAEAADDVAVLLGVFQVLIARRAVKLDAAELVGEFLRMHERQEQKAAVFGRQVLVVGALERAVGGRARQRIGREGARLAAEHVARELVEHDHQRERVFGGVLPGGQLAGRG